MTDLENRPRKNRFTLYMALLFVCVLLPPDSYRDWSGYRLGKTQGEIGEGTAAHEVVSKIRGKGND
jgi:hypothetical protein